MFVFVLVYNWTKNHVVSLESFHHFVQHTMKKKEPVTATAVTVAVAITVTFHFSNYKLNLLRICCFVFSSNVFIYTIWYMYLLSRKIASQQWNWVVSPYKWILTVRVQKHIWKQSLLTYLYIHFNHTIQSTQMTKAIYCLRKFQHSFLSHSSIFFFLTSIWIENEWVRVNETEI